jgi:hypothetical protein
MSSVAEAKQLEHVAFWVETSAAVMARLDRAIHERDKGPSRLLDGRVKPGRDNSMHRQVPDISSSNFHVGLARVELWRLTISPTPSKARGVTPGLLQSLPLFPPE